MNYAPKPERYQGWPFMLIEPGSQAPDGIDPAMHTPHAVVTVALTVMRAADNVFANRSVFSFIVSETVTLDHLSQDPQLCRSVAAARCLVWDVAHAARPDAQQIRA